MSSRANVYRPSGTWVVVRSGYCPFGLLSGRATVFRVSVHRATVCRGGVLGEVSVWLVSGRATVWIPYRSPSQTQEEFDSS